jgi:hypothetical protein
MVGFFAFASSVLAQQALYPLKEGIVQPLRSIENPRLTLDMELRGRTEEQTSLGYVSGKDRLYELTRVWGGMTVVPTNWLTVYGQFMDLHALGLPLQDTAANMRDTFDLRQGYLDFHYKPVQFVVGRQELRIGDERVGWYKRLDQHQPYLGRIPYARRERQPVESLQHLGGHGSSHQPGHARRGTDLPWRAGEACDVRSAYHD